METKLQTSAQRLANPVWLRAELLQLVKGCGACIKEDQERAAETRGEARAFYSTRVEVHQHWKRQLERILRGQTSDENLLDAEIIT